MSTIVDTTTPAPPQIPPSIPPQTVNSSKDTPPKQNTEVARRESPERVLRRIRRTDYANKGPAIYSKLIHIKNGNGSGYVSSNCFLGFLGRGKAFNGYILKFSASKKVRMPRTFSVFAVNILTTVLHNGLPYRPTIPEMEKAYKMYINKAISDL